MKWKELSTLVQLDRIAEISKDAPVLIFKHSTRCNISKAALDRLERSWTPEDDTAHNTYFLDLLAHRDLSDAVATRYHVRHESPQALVIRGGRCVHSTTHLGITYPDTVEALAV